MLTLSSKPAEQHGSVFQHISGCNTGLGQRTVLWIMFQFSCSLSLYGTWFCLWTPIKKWSLKQSSFAHILEERNLTEWFFKHCCLSWSDDSLKIYIYIFSYLPLCSFYHKNKEKRYLLYGFWYFDIDLL